eukprot:SAG22_NODE_139_length_18025_cov_4.352058_5_plen_141_part_00
MHVLSQQAPHQLLGDTQLLLLKGLQGVGRHEEIRGRWLPLKFKSADAPAPRHRHSLLAVGAAEFLLFGGTDGTGFFGDVWRLQLELVRGADDPEDGVLAEWTQLQCVGPAPAPRASHAAWISGREMFVHGGWGADPTGTP